MAQDLKTVVADITADTALLDQPNLSNDQLFNIIDKMFARDSQVVQKATQTLTECLSQLKAERARLQQQQLEAERARPQQNLAQWAYNILASMLAWDQATDLAKLNKQIQELEKILSPL